MDGLWICKIYGAYEKPEDGRPSQESTSGRQNNKKGVK